MGVNVCKAGAGEPLCINTLYYVFELVSIRPQRVLCSIKYDALLSLNQDYIC